MSYPPHVWLAIGVIVCTALAVAIPLSESKSAFFRPRPDIRIHCFRSNPDIAGLGGRASTYAQSIFLIITTLFFITDGHVDSRERKALKTSYENLIMTAGALLITAYVQVCSPDRELSFYHALLVLDWSWMLTTNALIISILSTIDSQVVSKWFRFPFPSRISQLPAMIIVSLQMSFMATFGLFVWYRQTGQEGASPESVGNPASCLKDVTTHVFTLRIQAWQRGLRLIYLVLYFIVAIPFVNVLLFTGTVVAIVNGINALIPKSYKFGRFHRILWVVQTVMNIVILLDTERTIGANRDLIGPGESRSGFDQILTLFLVVSPALQVLAEKLQRTFTGRFEYQIQRFCCESEQSWEDIHNEGSEKIDSVLSKLRRPNTHTINKHAHTATISTLTNAKGYLRAADETIRRRLPSADHAVPSRPISLENTEKSPVGAPEDQLGSSAGPGTTSMTPDGAHGEVPCVLAAPKARPPSADDDPEKGDPMGELAATGMTSAPLPGSTNSG